MTRLGVNIDHIATIREARRAIEPDPVAAAVLAELAGADGITVHLRSDRRHIKDLDVRRLRETVTTRLNLEMAAAAEMVRIALELRPDQATLVPERPGEVTTEGGLDAVRNMRPLATAIRRLQKGDIQVSLFIDPEPAQVDAAAKLGVTMIELNTRAFSESCPRSPDLAGPDYKGELTKVLTAAARGSERGMRILAGHGLTYRNVSAISSIPIIEELNIGHSIVARAALVGVQQAVAEMLAVMRRAPGREAL